LSRSPPWCQIGNFYSSTDSVRRVRQTWTRAPCFSTQLSSSSHSYFLRSTETKISHCFTKRLFMEMTLDRASAPFQFFRLCLFRLLFTIPVVLCFFRDCYFSAAGSASLVLSFLIFDNPLPDGTFFAVMFSHFPCRAGSALCFAPRFWVRTSRPPVVFFFQSSFAMIQIPSSFSPLRPPLLCDFSPGCSPLKETPSFLLPHGSSHHLLFLDSLVIMFRDILGSFVRSVFPCVSPYDAYPFFFSPRDNTGSSYNPLVIIPSLRELRTAYTFIVGFT